MEWRLEVLRCDSDGGRARQKVDPGCIASIQPQREIE